MSQMHRCLHCGVLFALLALASAPALRAQEVNPPGVSIPRVPRLSQGAESRQIIGLSQITITYHRPGVKGRTIWGGLLPYNEVWRAGANEPTLVSFSDPVTIDGQTLAAGTYRFLVIPSTSSWTLIFNSEVKNWGSVHDSTFDVLKLTATPEAGPHEEWMSFSFTDLTSSAARVVLAWEKMRVGFTARFATMQKLESSLGGWRILNQAARYAMSEEGAGAKALEWVDQSLAFERNGANTRTKAEILAKQRKYEEAVRLGEESIALTRARNPAADLSTMEKMLAEWKSMK